MFNNNFFHARPLQLYFLLQASFKYGNLSLDAKKCFPGSSEVLMIESAMRTISFVSCIKFLEWDGTAADYVHFQPDNKRLG